MSKRIARGQCRKRHCGADGLVELAGVAQGANEPMVRFIVRIVSHFSGGDGCAKKPGCFSRCSGCEQFERVLGQGLGSSRIGCGHGCL